MLNKRTYISENRWYQKATNSHLALNASAHMRYATMSAAAGTILTIQVQVNKNQLQAIFNFVHGESHNNIDKNNER